MTTTMTDCHQQCNVLYCRADEECLKIDCQEVMLEKLDNSQTKDRIAAILRQEILSGRIADGVELTQEQVAELLGVSRMPIREAFQILELEGFLFRLPNRHVEVVGFNRETIHENLQLIAAIEIEVIMTLVRANKSSLRVTYLNEEQFHKQFLMQPAHVYITQILKKLLCGYPQYYWDNVDNRPDVSLLHNAIIQAIAIADESMIAQLIRQYYQSMAEVLLQHVDGR